MLRTFTPFIIIFSIILFFTNVLAGETPEEFGYLDVSLEIDTAVKDFRGDVSIVLKDAVTDRQYQYVFREKHNYVLPDNPIKVIANTVYEVETYIHNMEGVSVADAGGEPVREIFIPVSGANLVLRVVNSAAGEIWEAVPPNSEMDINSLIPVMESFYENTAHAVNGDIVKRLELWTGGPTRDRFLRDPNHKPEQWEGLTLYEKANYLALTIIPFDMLFVYKDVHININDKTTFTKPLLQEIDYINVASTDGGAYYNEVCKVIDWIWDYYVHNREFVNVIDEYEKLKTSGALYTAKNEVPDNHDNAAGDEIEAQTSGTPVPAVLLDIAEEQTPTVSTNESTGKNKLDDITKTTLSGLIEKLKKNVIPFLAGAVLLLAFYGLKQLRLKREFQSEEDTSREN